MFLIGKSFWEIKATKKKGRGVFAQNKIAAGTIIGDYTGKLIPFSDVDFEKERKNLYLMYYDDKTGIYPDLKKPGVHLINHSCDPNCWIRKYQKHTLVFTLKNIKKGEELTINYLLSPKKGCKNCTHRCFCKSLNCTRTMHLSEDDYQKWQRFQEKDSQKLHKGATRNKYLAPLSGYPANIPASYINSIKNLNIKSFQP